METHCLNMETHCLGRQRRVKRVGAILGVFLCCVLGAGTKALSQDYYDWSQPFFSRKKVKEASPVIDVLDLKQVDIYDALKLISQKSGFNIIAGQEIRGNITVYLKQIEALEALKIIVEANGWAYVREGEVIKVISEQNYEKRYGEKFGILIKTEVVPLLYVHPGDIIGLLNQIKSPLGKILSDDKSNMVILKDTAEKVHEMARIIEQMDVAIQTEVFDLSYAQAEPLAQKILEILTPKVGSMKFDERSNKIVISDTAAKREQIRALIFAFDQKDKGVLIEAKILQVALTDEHKMGVNWEAVVSRFHNMSLVSDFDVLGAAGKKGKVSMGTLKDDDYTILIEALNEVGRTDILSRPRITTVNNKEAKILVGMTEPYVTTTTMIPDSGPPTTAETVNFIEVGVKLKVKPIIHNDGFITMKIKPEVSSVVGNLITSNNNTIPIVETSEAETTVIVKDGVTIVIGGLIKEEKINASARVPVLGEMPIIGNAFKNERDYVKKTEIVIFMTPRIISGDSS